MRDVGYDPKDYQIDCYIHDQSPDIAGAVEPELAEGEDEDTLGAGDQGVMVGYACNETPEYLPMPVVAAQRLVTLLEISRMTGVIPDIGPDGKVQVTMEYNGDTPVRITTVVISVQHKEDPKRTREKSSLRIAENILDIVNLQKLALGNPQTNGVRHLPYIICPLRLQTGQLRPCSRPQPNRNRQGHFQCISARRKHHQNRRRFKPASSRCR